MQQVRAGRTQQVAVPPATPTALEASREERQQLRIARHHAFQRHQRNAAWVGEVLAATQRGWAASDSTVGSNVTVTGNSRAEDDRRQDKQIAGQTSESEREQLLRKVADAARQVSETRAQLTTREQSIASDQQSHVEECGLLRAIGSHDELASCRKRVLDTVAHHEKVAARDRKVVKL